MTSASNKIPTGNSKPQFSFLATKANFSKVINSKKKLMEPLPSDVDEGIEVRRKDNLLKRFFMRRTGIYNPKTKVLVPDSVLPCLEQNSCKPRLKKKIKSLSAVTPGMNKFCEEPLENCKEITDHTHFLRNLRHHDNNKLTKSEEKSCGAYLGHRSNKITLEPTILNCLNSGQHEEQHQFYTRSSARNKTSCPDLVEENKTIARHRNDGKDNACVDVTLRSGATALIHKTTESSESSCHRGSDKLSWHSILLDKEVEYCEVYNYSDEHNQENIYENCQTVSRSERKSSISLTYGSNQSLVSTSADSVNQKVLDSFLLSTEEETHVDGHDNTNQQNDVNMDNKLQSSLTKDYYRQSQDSAEVIYARVDDVLTNLESEHKGNITDEELFCVSSSVENKQKGFGCLHVFENPAVTFKGTDILSGSLTELWHSCDTDSGLKLSTESKPDASSSNHHIKQEYPITAPLPVSTYIMLDGISIDKASQTSQVCFSSDIDNVPIFLPNDVLRNESTIDQDEQALNHFQTKSSMPKTETLFKHSHNLASDSFSSVLTGKNLQQQDNDVGVISVKHWWSFDSEHVTEKAKNEQVTEKAKKEQVTEKVKNEQVTEKVKNEQVTEKVKNEQVTEKVKNEQVTEKVKNEQVTEKVKNEQVIEKVKNEQVTEKAKKEQVTEKVKKEQVTEKAKNEQVTEKAKNEQVTEKVKNEQVTEKVKNEQVTEKAKKEQVTEKVKKEQVTEKAKNEQVTEKAKNEQVTEKVNNEQVTEKVKNEQVTEKAKNEAQVNISIVNLSTVKNPNHNSKEKPASFLQLPLLHANKVVEPCQKSDRFDVDAVHADRKQCTKSGWSPLTCVLCNYTVEAVTTSIDMYSCIHYQQQRSGPFPIQDYTLTTCSSPKSSFRLLPTKPKLPSTKPVITISKPLQIKSKPHHFKSEHLLYAHGTNYSSTSVPFQTKREKSKAENKNSAVNLNKHLLKETLKGLDDYIFSAKENVDDGSAVDNVDDGNAIENVNDGVGRAIENIDDGLNRAIENVDDGVGRAIENLDDGLGRAIENVDDGLGRAIENVDDGVCRAKENVHFKEGDQKSSRHSFLIENECYESTGPLWHVTGILNYPFSLMDATTDYLCDPSECCKHAGCQRRILLQETASVICSDAAEVPDKHGAPDLEMTSKPTQFTYYEDVFNTTAEKSIEDAQCYIRDKKNDKTVDGIANKKHKNIPEAMIVSEDGGQSHTAVAKKIQQFYHDISEVGHNNKVPDATYRRFNLVWKKNDNNTSSLKLDGKKAKKENNNKLGFEKMKYKPRIKPKPAAVAQVVHKKNEISRQAKNSTNFPLCRQNYKQELCSEIEDVPEQTGEYSITVNQDSDYELINSDLSDYEPINSDLSDYEPINSDLSDYEPINSDGPINSDLYEPINYTEEDKLHKENTSLEATYDEIKQTKLKLRSLDSNGYEIPANYLTKPVTHMNNEGKEFHILDKEGFMYVSKNKSLLFDKPQLMTVNRKMKINRDPEINDNTKITQDKQVCSLYQLHQEENCYTCIKSVKRCHKSEKDEEKEELIADTTASYRVFKYPRRVGEGQIYVNRPILLRASTKQNVSFGHGDHKENVNFLHAEVRKTELSHVSDQGGEVYEASAQSHKRNEFETTIDIEKPSRESSTFDIIEASGVLQVLQAKNFLPYVAPQRCGRVSFERARDFNNDENNDDIDADQHDNPPVVHNNNNNLDSERAESSNFQHIGNNNLDNETAESSNFQHIDNNNLDNETAESSNFQHVPIITRRFTDHHWKDEPSTSNGAVACSNESLKLRDFMNYTTEDMINVEEKKDKILSTYFIPPTPGKRFTHPPLSNDLNLSSMTCTEVQCSGLSHEHLEDGVLLLTELDESNITKAEESSFSRFEKYGPPFSKAHPQHRTVEDSTDHVLHKTADVGRPQFNVTVIPDIIHRSQSAVTEREDTTQIKEEDIPEYHQLPVRTRQPTTAAQPSVSSLHSKTYGRSALYMDVVKSLHAHPSDVINKVEYATPWEESKLDSLTLQIQQQQLISLKKPDTNCPVRSNRTMGASDDLLNVSFSVRSSQLVSSLSLDDIRTAPRTPEQISPAHVYPAQISPAHSRHLRGLENRGKMNTFFRALRSLLRHGRSSSQAPEKIKEKYGKKF